MNRPSAFALISWIVAAVGASASLVSPVWAVSREKDASGLRQPPLTEAAAAASPFEVPARLRRNVDFWIAIYSKYSTSQGVVHDAKYVDKVFEAIDFRGREGSRARIQREAKRKWRDILLSVHRKQSDPSSFTPEERQVFYMYADVTDPDKFLNAAHRKRLRFQLGQSDRFREGIEASGEYLPAMEEIFRREKLPIELTRLPLVESSFSMKARSKVGASGVWQFMRSTGLNYLMVNDEVDERNDPIRATEAAARLLKSNYQSLGTWPLAVTAYNHGRMGMMRAVRQVGSDDFSDVYEGYRSRTFGFASSNYFASLLAAVEIERNSAKYFGPIHRQSLGRYSEVPLPQAIRLKDLSRFMGLKPRDILELNPALQSSVTLGKARIPAGYRLRIRPSSRLSPEAGARVFLAGFAKIPKMFKSVKQRGTNYGSD